MLRYCFSFLLFFSWGHHIIVVKSLVSGVSRCDFLQLMQQAIISQSLLLPLSNRKSSSLILPLRFLPIGGCWALKLILSDEERDYEYYGVVDTGSPFLTAPSSVTNVTQKTLYPTTQEQYGESHGDIAWRKAPYLTILGSDSTILESQNILVGVVESEKVLQESGGIFVGMIPLDDNRPSFLQQLVGGKYTSFVVNFAQNKLQLSNAPIIDVRDPDSFPLMDLQPYGPDLYHFAIDCPTFLVKQNDGTEEIIESSTLKRPVLVVLDTGLTGCIFSDSLLQELSDQKRIKRDKHYSIKGLSISLKTQNKDTLTLSSSDQYWMFSSFHLPWFYDEDQHPHIIALGCTFWNNAETLAIDTISRRAKLSLKV